MADKNVKAELNAENLEGVAGGASVNIVDVDEKTLREDSPHNRNGAPDFGDPTDILLPKDAGKKNSGRGNVDAPKIKF